VLHKTLIYRELINVDESGMDLEYAKIPNSERKATRERAAARDATNRHGC
jgi:hypothetical protein